MSHAAFESRSARPGLSRVLRLRGISVALLLLVAWNTPAIAQNAETPGAFELIERVRAHYQGLDAYADEGSISWYRALDGPEADWAEANGAGSPFRRLDFVAARSGRAVRLELSTQQGARRVLWGESTAEDLRSDDAFVWDAGLDQILPQASLPAAFVRSLGSEALDVLVVPLLLAGSDEALADPEGAAVDGPLPCPQAPEVRHPEAGTCWFLTLSRMAGDVESEIWVDTGPEPWVRRVDVLSAHVGLPFERKIESPPLRGEPARARVRIVHHRLEATRAADLATFQPPATARRVDAWSRPAADAPADLLASVGGGPMRIFEDSIQVRLLSYRVHAVDPRGESLRGLVADDFEVRLGDAEIPVRSVDWMATDQSHLDHETIEAMRSAGVEPEPFTQRLVVFVQAGLDRSYERGHIQLHRRLDELLRTLGPRDEVAVTSFDSHLKLWLDFTTDREAVLDVVGRAAFFTADPADLETGDDARRRGDLHRVWNRIEAEDAAWAEDALEHLGHWLAEVPGDETMVYLGYGLGTFGAGGVRFEPRWYRAVHALAEAGVPVFVLDIADADRHSLEVGIQELAFATGGAYHRTNNFPSSAIGQVSQALEGRYILTVDGAAVEDAAAAHPGEALDIRLRGRKGKIYGPPKPLG